jgi:hypothetical protein
MEPTENEMKDARRRLMLKRALEVVGWLAAVALFAFAGRAVLAQDASVDAPRNHTRERTARERRADLSPAAIVRDARTVYVRPTKHLDKKYLEYKLLKYPELRDWGLMLVEDEAAADLIISFDKTALNYIFTVTDPRTSVIVTGGKCVAVNGRLAAEYLGKEIIKKIKDVRASPVRRPRKDDDDEEWSES